MTILFFGSDAFGIPALEALAGRHALAGVVTAPDRPRGRGRRIGSTPVKEWAAARSVPVLQPERFDGAAAAAVRALAPDAIVLISYGKILPARILEIPRVAPVNIHPSILPAYRGAAPMEWALIRGERETGVTAIRMSPRLDRGDVVLMRTVAIAPDDTIFTLRDRLAAVSAEILPEALDRCAAGAETRPQAAGGCYAPKLSKEDGRIDWTMEAGRVRNLVRGVLEWPGAWTTAPGLRGERLLKVWECRVGGEGGRPARPGTVVAASGEGVSVACGDGVLLVTRLQMEGRRAMAAGEFLRGHPLAPGTVLGSSGTA